MFLVAATIETGGQAKILAPLKMKKSPVAHRRLSQRLLIFSGQFALSGAHAVGYGNA
jgi:hypothetical protein